MTSEVIDRASPAAPRSRIVDQPGLQMRNRFHAILASALMLSSPLALGQAPTPEDQQLARLAGHWTVRQSLWTSPDAPPAIDAGSATFAMVLGHHLRQELHVDGPGKPFEGLGYIGYDGAAGDYYSSWRDVNFSGVILARGHYDAAAHTYTFTGTMADPAKAGATIPLREVLRTSDADHFAYEYYETRGGEEKIAVRLEYTRTK